MARFAVLFDACVLYPAPLRDSLMRLATSDLFKAHWTDAIHEEWINALMRENKHPREAPCTRFNGQPCARCKGVGL